MNEVDARFVDSIIRKKGVFMTLMWVGVVVGACLMGWAIYKGVSGESWSATFVIAILVLLNARFNLRQVKVSRILYELTAGSGAAPQDSTQP